jgi:SAM-dependent methyltransferase
MVQTNQKFANLKHAISGYYTAKVTEFGATPKGVDWRDEASQEVRFEQLLITIGSNAIESLKKPDCCLLDYGCGYGALLTSIRARGLETKYIGFDWSQAMIDTATKQHALVENCSFLTGDQPSQTADFVVASGIFNVKLALSEENFASYINETLHKLDSLSTEGFAFNMLTSHSDDSKKRSDLYYCDPSFYLDYCLKHFSRSVQLVHGYGLYEFTIGVNKDTCSLEKKR